MPIWVDPAAKIPYVLKEDREKPKKSRPPSSSAS